MVGRNWGRCHTCLFDCVGIYGALISWCVENTLIFTQDTIIHNTYYTTVYLVLYFTVWSSLTLLWKMVKCVDTPLSNPASGMCNSISEIKFPTKYLSLNNYNTSVYFSQNTSNDIYFPLCLYLCVCFVSKVLERFFSEVINWQVFLKKSTIASVVLDVCFNFTLLILFILSTSIVWNKTTGKRTDFVCVYSPLVWCRTLPLDLKLSRYCFCCCFFLPSHMFILYFNNGSDNVEEFWSSEPLALWIKY